MNLSEIIRQFRGENSLTMQQFADNCGLSKGYISMLEKGMQPRNKKKIVPSIGTLAKIAQAMRITTDELVAQLDDNQKIFVGQPSSSNDTLSSTEQSLITEFRSLNKEGQEKVLDYTADLVASGRYIKNTPTVLVDRQA